MSSFLYKGFFTQASEDKRVIEVNDLVEKRLDELKEKAKKREMDGFKAGIDPVASVPVDSELPGGEEVLEEGQTIAGNVIKAAEMSERATAEAEEIIKNAKAEADALMKETYETIDKMRKDAMKKAETQRIEIEDNARRNGYAEGMEQAQAELDAMKAELEQKKTELENTYQQYVDELEPKMVDTITSIYEQIFKVDLASNRELVMNLLTSAMKNIEGGGDFLVHVSPEDYPYVSMQKKLLQACITAADSTLEIVEDVGLSAGQTMIETGGGIFDCGLGTELEELSSKLKLLSFKK